MTATATIRTEIARDHADLLTAYRRMTLPEGCTDVDPDGFTADPDTTAEVLAELREAAQSDAE